MHIQKRAIHPVRDNDRAREASVDTSEKSPQYWRRFMNERVIDRAYTPTNHEHLANCLTHGCLIVPSLVGVQRLISHAKTPAQYWSSIVYGNALIFLFSSSTVFHCTCFHPTYRDSTMRHLLNRLDRGIIYIFISASYTPWFLLRPTETISATFPLAIVWLMAVLGVIYQILYHGRYKWLELYFYVILGVCPAIFVIDMTEHGGVFELAVGGLLFLLGILFFQCDGIIPFAHAIWHCFVFFGAAIHYYAIYTHLLGPPLTQGESD